MTDGIVFTDAALMEWAAFEFPEYSPEAQRALVATALANDVDPRSYPRQYRLSKEIDPDGNVLREYVHRATVSLEGEVDSYCRAAGLAWRAGAVQFYTPHDKPVVRLPVGLRAKVTVDADLCASLGADQPGDLVCTATIEDNQAMRDLMVMRDERIASEINLRGGKVSAAERGKIIKSVEDVIGQLQWTVTSGTAVFLASEPHEMNPRRPITRVDRVYLRAYRTALRNRFDPVMIRRGPMVHGMTPQPPALEAATA